MHFQRGSIWEARMLWLRDCDADGGAINASPVV